MKRLLLCAVLCAAQVRGEQDPTPFWMPPPPPSKKEPAKPKKKKKPVQVEPLEITPPPAEKRKPEAQRPAAKPAERPEPTWIEPPSRAAEPAPRPKRAPIEPVEIEPAPAPQTTRAPAARAVPVVPREVPPPARSPAAEPRPIIAEPEPIILPDPEPESGFRQPDFRRWSISASFGAWSKSRSDGGGRTWDMAYGLRFAFALFPSVELELHAVRAGGGAGSPFVSASSAHTLAALRAFWVLGDRFALLLGGGGGVALAQTHYALLPSTEPGVVGTGLDANALKSVIQITAAGRARIFGGLEARAEVSAMARDGRLELLPLLGLGAAF